MSLDRFKKIRLAVLGAILVLVAGGWALNAAHVHALENELGQVAEQHREESDSPGYEVASVTTVSKPYIVFGTPRAKIEVFLRPDDAEEAEVVQGIEYFYEKAGGDWELVESGQCTGEECRVRGREAFAGAFSSSVVTIENGEE